MGCRGMLARVWLFYTGYYKKDELAGIVSKSQVTAFWMTLSPMVVSLCCLITPIYGN